MREMQHSFASCLARSASELTILIGVGAGSPRRGTKALDQKIYEDLHLGRLMTARRQQTHSNVSTALIRMVCHPGGAL